jgi:hypothetical protein
MITCIHGADSMKAGAVTQSRQMKGVLQQLKDSQKEMQASMITARKQHDDEQAALSRRTEDLEQQLREACSTVDSLTDDRAALERNLEAIVREQQDAAQLAEGALARERDLRHKVRIMGTEVDALKQNVCELEGKVSELEGQARDWEIHHASTAQILVAMDGLVATIDATTGTARTRAGTYAVKLGTLSKNVMSQAQDLSQNMDAAMHATRCMVSQHAQVQQEARDKVRDQTNVDRIGTTRIRMYVPH